MRAERSKNSKLSWSKTLIKNWFKIKSKAPDLHPNQGSSEEWRNNFPEREASTINNTKTGDKPSRRISNVVPPSKIGLEASPETDVNSYRYRIFVATWNVAGKSPPSNLNIEDWINASPPADVYVLGFQEIVPLNAGNVLGTEDNGPAKKWLELIQNTLNNLPGSTSDCHSPQPIHPISELDSNFEGSTEQKATSFFRQRSFQSLSRSMRMTSRDISMSQPWLERRFSVCDRVISGQRISDYGPTFSWSSFDRPFQGNPRYSLVVSKQMVGIFLTVWVKTDLRKHVCNIKVSCVEPGLMGYLGNKGSISISMSLHQTSFCFVCCHLTSGQKEGDELRRNSDVMEILRKTKFPRIRGMRDYNSPQSILEHDRIIWLGDLNYRIALSYHSAKALVEMCNWRTLLENDQLRIEKRRGHVFVGWHEGKIHFPPTYKYLNDSDRYVGDDMIPKDSWRTPAWCDRILWYGRGLHQISYVRGESRFSDHRPVYSIFVCRD